MKFPNGYGGISKLPGNRRNPWRVRVTTGWIIDEKTQKAKQQHVTIGYYPTRTEALKALANYNANPYDINAQKVTFAEVYEKWSKKKYEEISDSNVNGYKASYKVCGDLYEMRFADIKLSHLQAVIDNSGKAYPTRRKIKILLNQMFDYAVVNEIIPRDKHIVEYVNVGKEEKSEKHYRFNDKEIETLWRWSTNNEYVQLILMLIYSGVRPGELFNLKRTDLDLEQQLFTIRQGKNKNAARKVPLHKKTAPFFEEWAKKDTEYLITNRSGDKFNFDKNHVSYTDVYFTPVLKEMGILTYKNDKGDIKQHLPDDTRHTFTSMWREARLDEAMRRKIQGHSGKGIGEIVYTHYELDKLKEELNKLQ